ncbi:sigma-70 family RNA polymerase sigma factor [Streptomyces sp. LBUM 1479]|nr:sigma-70 protein [Streptomyces scabiei]MBP5872685.1 sigma-70 family RNA polymerase sigma factor [Streptomyces sp. LBUM 1485]MBP5911931.1 sigma-70 family RNA polymerase sigma factor [Streptomyces sp. LBUM 1486]MBP5934439.1 sigma-70 family RNA polymerase sigma factor [Streptomyces sp. LBUM 1479]QTU58567.1 sigma-70 family RNA polymerase sigma factor [Streptomyces sp. LBUM 1480]
MESMKEKRAARDQQAERARFEALAHVAAEPLHRYLLRRADPDQVDDVLSDTLLVLWRRIEDVPGLQPATESETEPEVPAAHVPDPDAVLPWCYGVARGCLANARRAERRRRSLLDRLTWTASTASTATEVARSGADHSDLHAALAQLRPLDREIVLLWAYEELAPSRIAEVTGLSANAVSIRLHRAKKKLAARLERKTGPRPGHETDEGTGIRTGTGTGNGTAYGTFGTRKGRSSR